MPIKMLNQIINEAVKHGADAGGSYSQNSKDLKGILNLYLLINDMAEYEVITRFDDEYNPNPEWDFEKLGLTKENCWTDIAIAKVR